MSHSIVAIPSWSVETLIIVFLTRQICTPGRAVAVSQGLFGTISDAAFVDDAIIPSLAAWRSRSTYLERNRLSITLDVFSPRFIVSGGTVACQASRLVAQRTRRAVRNESACQVQRARLRFARPTHDLGRPVVVSRSEDFCNVLRSRRGRSGGLALAKRPDKIRLGDVLRATEPDFALVECFVTGN
jgi:hypothetical protein